MGTLLVLIGLVGLVYGVVSMVFRKGKRAKGLKVFGIAFVVMIIGGAMVGTDETPEQADAEEEQAEEVEEEVDAEAEAKAEAEEQKKEEERIAKEKADKEKSEKEKVEKEKADKQKAAKEKEEEQVEDYQNFIIDHSAKFSGVLSDFSGQMGTFNQSDEWVLKTAGVIVQMQELVKEAEGFDNVPESFEHVHEAYLKGMAEYKIVADKLPTAVDNMDVALIEELTGNMEAGNFHINTATAMIEEMQYK